MSCLAIIQYNWRTAKKLSLKHPKNLIANQLNIINNNAESGNHVLKRAASWKLHQLPELINVLYDVVKVQMLDLERAMLGLGNFVLAQSYQGYSVQPHVWSGMTVKQHETRRSTFLTKGVPSSNKSVTSTDGALKIPVSLNAGRKPHQSRRPKAERAHPRPGNY